VIIEILGVKIVRYLWINHCGSGVVSSDTGYKVGDGCRRCAVPIDVLYW
jgi:hypothetical protein